MKKILLSLAMAVITVYTVNAQNLVLHYTLDDLTATVGSTGILIPNGSGTAANTDSLGATNTSGEHCASFFHGAGYVSTSALNNNGWTGTALSYWYKSQSTYQGTIVQGAYLGFVSRIYPNGHVEATFDGSSSGSISSTVAINDGNWHHVVIQNNGTTTEIYIDGVLNNSGAETLYTLGGANSNAKIYLGSALNDNVNEKIHGKVDEIQVFDNVLSQAQIDALYAYSPCTVNIPDANFKAYLVGISAINTNGDSEIQCSEAAAFTGYFNCSSLSIADLTGIEAFTGIIELDCSNNQITSLDISNNTALTALTFHNNQITSLDVSNNTALTSLTCYYNQLTSLDVSNNTALMYLWCYANPLTNLDVSNNTALIQLRCNNNQLTSLNVSSNTALTQLHCFNNQLTSLDVSNNMALTELRCGNNLLTSLNMSSNAALTQLFCDLNQLTELNIANGNNINFTSFWAEGNPNLTCIEVDDAAYSTANWTNIDAGASFSENCSGTAGVNDIEQEIIFRIYPNPASTMLNIEVKDLSTPLDVQIVNLLGKTVATQTLKTGNNNIDVSELTKGVYFIHSDKGGATKFIKE